MKAKIFELFPSLQGEGKYIGVRQVFVRFFECHMHCVWCDTPDTIGDGRRDYKEYSLEELVAAIRPLIAGSHSVSLTGGEPLLQADFIKDFIPLFKKSGLKIYLETSGVLYKELDKIIDQVDIIAMDMKLPSSTEARNFWREHEEFLKRARKKDLFIKTVISGQTTRDDLQKAVELVARYDPEIIFYLQPNHFESSNGILGKCLLFQQYCSQYLREVRVVPQIHKLMNLP